MAKKSNTSPKPVASKAKAPEAPKAAAPKHRRTTKPKVAEVASLDPVPVEVADKAEPVSKVTSSHHPEVNTELEVSRFTITHEDIATLAFSYWERRGYVGGSPEEDWRRADEELQSLLG